MTDIVLVGSVDFGTLSATWLKDQGIVRPSEADRGAVTESLTDTLYSLKAGAFSLSANASKLSIQASLGNAPVVKDLMLGLLLLDKASSIRGIGLNFHGHYRYLSAEPWHKVGDTLVPKSVWNSLFPDFHAGMQTVQVRMESEESSDRIEVTVQPSGRFEFGVYAAWNGHFVPAANTKPDWAIDVIKTHYDDMRNESFKKFEEIFAKCI